MKYLVKIKDQEYNLHVTGFLETAENGNRQTIDLVPLDANRFSALIGTKSYVFEIYQQNGEKFLVYKNHTFPLVVEDERDRLVSHMKQVNRETQTFADIKAPMPGLVSKILVTEGGVVQKGQTILVLEAMKMENDVKSPIAGVVSMIKVTEKQNVEKNSILMRIG